MKKWFGRWLCWLGFHKMKWDGRSFIGPGIQVCERCRAWDVEDWH